ncbi:MAG TPA: hypothetical protein IAA76_00545 [Candidatus Ornithospirochaeta stercorigallinarum]|nr:hypothetical protein [Candidatus Ornithospirochaeta stercorigallinarum]
MKKELLLNNLQGGTVFDKNQFKVIVRMTNPSYKSVAKNPLACRWDESNRFRM